MGFASEGLGAPFCSLERDRVQAEQWPFVEGGKLQVTKRKGGNHYRLTVGLGELSSQARGSQGM